MPTRSPTAALLLILALTSGPALAAPGSSEDDKASARTLARDGYTALENKDFAGALELFTRAEALYRAPSVLLGLARAQAALGHLLDARATYERLLAEPMPLDASSVIVTVYTAAGADRAALLARIPTVSFVVHGAASARITLDGAAIPPADLAVKRPAEPGRHHARAEASGFAAAEAEVTLAEGQSVTITLALTPLAAVSSPVPLAPRPSPALRPAAPPPWWTPRRELGVGLGAGGVAALGAGAALGVAALGKRRDLLAACPTAATCPADQQGAIDSYHALGAASPALLLVGGAAAVTGLVLFFTARTAPPAGQATITPRVGAGYLGVGGSF